MKGFVRLIKTLERRKEIKRLKNNRKKVYNKEELGELMKENLKRKKDLKIVTMIINSFKELKLGLKNKSKLTSSFHNILRKKISKIEK